MHIAGINHSADVIRQAMIHNFVKTPGESIVGVAHAANMDCPPTHCPDHLSLWLQRA